MRHIAILTGLVLCSVTSALAQITVDVSKITCDQYIHSKIAAPRLVAAWLSGYYHAKRNDQLLDLQNFEANLSRLEKFCYQEKNFKVPLLSAVEQVAKPGK